MGSDVLTDLDECGAIEGVGRRNIEPVITADYRTAGTVLIEDVGDEVRGLSLVRNKYVVLLGGLCQLHEDLGVR